MRAHIITDGIVTNTIIVDSLGDGLVDGSIGGIGWTYSNGVLTPPPTPPVPVPQSVTMRQARLALFAAGLLDSVTTAIAGAGSAAQIEWEYAATVERASGLVPSMATALGMTDVQIDALFIAASTL
jgi:hypothetical protein